MTKWIVVTVVFALISFFLTPVLWPHPVGMTMPPMNLLPLYILLGVLESVIFGIGISFLMFGYPLVKKASEKTKPWSWLVYIAIAWMLVSWWPHDNLHMIIGLDMSRLVWLEYGFHVTLMIAGLIIAYTFFHPLVYSAKNK